MSTQQPTHALKKEIEKLRQQINQQKISEGMLKKYEFIANSSQEFMTLINSRYEYETVNDAYCHAHNRSRSEFIGNTVEKVWGKDIFNGVIKKYLDQCFSGKKVRYQQWFDFSALGKRYFDVIYYPYKGKGDIVTNTIVVTRDITDLKVMEERQRELELELMKEQRLSSIGLLTAGIAHNIRNPLTVISMQAEMMKEKQPENKSLDPILSQAKEITRILDTMMIKCRKEQESDKTEIELNNLLKTELDFLETDLDFKHKIKKDYQFADNLPTVTGVYSDFSQGLINIINNATDAMFQSADKILSVRTHYDSNTIFIDIKDTGCGINKESIPKLFDPFFTTKAYHSKKRSAEPKGTGLGLFSSYQILKPYGVLFDIESEINKGTTVHIKIPYDNHPKPNTGSK